jgi:anti-sigma-K factor RskA
MDYARPELADRLAAEYVLGTLRGPARRRFQALLPGHPALRRATQDWERRLAQLAEVTPAVQPSTQVWRGIEQRLFPAQAGEAPSSTPGNAPTRPVRKPVFAMARWWQRLGVWQGATGLATAFGVVMAVLLAQPAPMPKVQPPIVVGWAPHGAAATGGIQPAGFVASLSGDGRSLVLKPLDEHQRVAVHKALELWAVPANGSPRSLGLVSDQHATTVLRTKLLQDTAAFAVSVEPPGGSPSGAPTGPIVSVGKLQL